MSYSTIGTKIMPEESEITNSLTELKAQLRSLIDSVNKELNSKVNTLGANQIEAFGNRLDGLAVQMSAFLTIQESLSSRIGVLEGCVANIEATTSEILNLWRG